MICTKAYVDETPGKPIQFPEIYMGNTVLENKSQMLSLCQKC